MRSSVVRSIGSDHPKANHLHASGRSGADPARPQAAITFEPRDASSLGASPHPVPQSWRSRSPFTGAGRNEATEDATSS